MQNKQDYLKRFFPDGKTVIVPIDHGTAIPVPGLENPADLIEALNVWADGYVVNVGGARSYANVLEGKGVCLRTDVYKPAVEGNPDEGAVRVFDVNDALSLGADAVMNMLYPHHRNEGGMARECAGLVQQSIDSEVPVIVEALPFGLGIPEKYTAENVAFATRMAAELGADVVKTTFPTGATVAEFAAIIAACPVPVVVLGGARATDDEGVLAMVGEAMEAGAKGVAIGRNVWQHESPVKMAEALHAIVHDGVAVDTAVRIVNGD